MDNLQDSINELNNNIVQLNRNILTLLAGNGSEGGGSGFSIELLKDALLNVEVQELLVEIVNYNQYNRKPLVKEDRKPLENTQAVQVTQQKIISQQKQEDTIKKEEEKQEAVIEETQFTNSEIVETLYTVKAPKNGYFTDTDKINDIFRTQYQINIFGDEGEFFIPESVDALRFLLSPEKFLITACEGDYDFNNTKDKLKKVETLKKGKVKKESGGWKIIKKAVIRVIKE